MVDGLPRARLHPIEGCGHVPHRECPGLFLEALDQALSEPPPQPSEPADDDTVAEEESGSNVGKQAGSLRHNGREPPDAGVEVWAKRAQPPAIIERAAVARGDAGATTRGNPCSAGVLACDVSQSHGSRTCIRWCLQLVVPACRSTVDREAA
jgi:hypothetical protein